jgi:hypothetical protein
MKVAVFWDIVPYHLVEVDRRFRDSYCLHNQGDEWVTHCPDDRDSKYLGNVGLLQQDHTVRCVSKKTLIFS